MRHHQARRNPARREPARREPARREPARRESARRESARRAAARLGLVVTVAAITTGTAGTAASAAPGPGQATRAARALGGPPLVRVTPGGGSMPLAGHSSSAAKYTLTVTGTNLAGKPDTGDEVIVYSADNFTRFGQGKYFGNGVATFSVPAGHYWAIGDFYNPAKNGGQPTAHLDVLPQFTVPGDTTVHAVAGAADSKITVATPRPAVMRSGNILFARRTAAGNIDSVDFEAAYPIFVNPTTRRPTVGTLHVFTTVALASPPGATGTPYTYNLVFGDTSGLVPPQRYAVQAASLATVRASYFSNRTGTGGQDWFGRFPGEFQDFMAPPLIAGIPVPGREIEYLTGNPAILWSDDYFRTFPNISGGQADVLRTFHAGQQAASNWSAFPLHEGYNTNPIGAANVLPWMPSASRAGDMLSLDVTPFSDSTPGHKGDGGFFIGSRGLGNHVTAHYEIDQNGKIIAGGNPLKGYQAVGPWGEFNTSVPLSPHPSTVRLTLDVAATGPLFSLSPADQTVWTWRSAHESGARLPAGWVCATRTTRSCAVEPMMTLGYAVSGLALSGSAPSGRQAVHLTVAHLQLAKAAPMTRASLSVSFDGGKTWHPATVTGHNGSYTATFFAPAGTKVSLRTRAADTAGGTVTETITNAYRTGP